MGRDDRILSINLNCGGRSHYVIYHVQAAENFTNVRYLLWFLSNRSDVRYTQRVVVSKKIISKLQIEIIEKYGEPEYDVMEIEFNFNEYINDIKFDKGKINFGKKFKHPWLDRSDIQPCTAFNY